MRTRGIIIIIIIRVRTFNEAFIFLRIYYGNILLFCGGFVDNKYIYNDV